MRRRILSMVLALALYLSMLPTTVLGAAAFTEETASATIRVTMSNDGAVLLGNDNQGSRVNLMTVTVPYFDLALYGLEQFYRYEAASFDEGGEYIHDTIIEQPTLLHLYIYLLERFYYGLPEEDCCKGAAYLKSQGITFGENTDAFDELGNSTGRNMGLHITGSATHLYLSNFWGHDENVMYYVNHSYPMMSKGVGATADYILLEDGDEVDLAMFSNWGFYTQGFFCYMDPDEKTVNAGESVTFQSYGVPTYAVSAGSTAPTEEVAVQWSVLSESGQEVETSEHASSSFTYTFQKAGSYTILGYDPNRGTEDACMAPAIAHVQVQAAMNTPPALSGAASGVAQISRSDTLPIDITSLFTDVDGDTLTYFFSTTGADYQQVSGSTYLFTPEAVGETKLYFKASDGKAESPVYTLTVTISELAGFLSELKIAASMSASSATPFALTPTFNAGVFSYEITVPDSTYSIYAWAVLSEAGAGGSITADYTDYQGTARSISIPPASGGNGKYLTNCVSTGTAGNTVSFRIQAGDQKQEYVVKLNRTRTLTSLSAVDEAGNDLIFDQSFSATTYDYRANTTSDQITIAAGLRNEGYQVTLNGSADHTVALQDGENRIEILVSYPADGTSALYTLTVNKLQAALLDFDVTPGDALVFLSDASNARIWQQNGKYALIPGNIYSYTVTKPGYVGQKNNFVASDSGTITLALTKAEENESIDKTIYAEWGNFRKGENHLGVTDAATPYDAQDAELLWAVRYGSGWASAPGSPILVDGALVTYIGSKLYKLDKNTGEVLQEGEMVGASSFSMVPATYADGMIFVGLSGGRIQAFNAKTLQSLWVYTDPLGGQPNSPITYKDGYLYAGFWNNHTADANFACIAATDEDVAETTEEKLASWTYASAGGFYWAGAYASDKYVVVGTDDGDSGYDQESAALLVFDRFSGELVASETGFRGDIRCNVSYDPGSDRVFFTTKGGQICNAKINWQTGKISSVHKTVIMDANDNEYAMSTCTPSVHNGRIYIGVSGTSQFTPSSGHAICVYDLAEDGTMTQAYAYAILGYPQTSAMLTTAYEAESGYVYIYLPYNYTPGGISVLKDKKGQTEPLTASGEGYSEVFSPSAPLNQYAICSTISDQYGTIYYKNDSCYMMAITSKIESIQVSRRPGKLRYENEAFDPAGMVVVANLANGQQRDITNCVTWPEGPISGDATSILLSYTYGFDSANYGLQTKTTELAINQVALQAQVTVSAQAENGFLCAPQTSLTVSSDLAEAYGYVDQLLYSDGVSALDALVRVHELIFGEGFDEETARTLLDVDQAGSITTIFGIKTTNCGFTINDLTPTRGDEASWGGYVGYTLNEAPVQTGDELSFFLYQDDWASDLYTWYEQNGQATRHLTAEAKLPVEFTVQGYVIGWVGCNYKSFDEIVADVNNAMPAEGAQLALVDRETGALTDLSGAVCEETGMVSVTFPEKGVYTITAYVPEKAQCQDYATPVIMTLATVTVGAHTHTWSQWGTVTEPDCTQPGQERRTCVCGEQETRAVPALGHDYESVVTPPSCTEGGYTTYSCGRCGDTYVADRVPALGHTWDEWKEAQAADCTHVGRQERSCSVCYEKQTRPIPALGHDYKAVLTAPTCTEGGYTTYTCSRCDDSYVADRVPALGHTWGDWTVSKQADCFHDGEEARTCPVCGEKQTRAIPKNSEACPSRQFVDVNEKLWYHQGVDYVLESGLMIGTSERTFSPNGPLTRGQVMTILYRMAGSPAAEGETPFTDVKAGAYYADAVAWAYDSGIAKGVSGTRFAPNQGVSREQLVTFFARYTVWNGNEVKAAGDLSGYEDADRVSAYAKEAMTWAVETGLIEGTGDNLLAPGHGSTRAQAAAMLLRYCTVLEFTPTP